MNYFAALFDALGLPADFREVVVPLVASQRPRTLEEVLTVWRAAFTAQQAHPEVSGDIATWCVSVAVYCAEVDARPDLLDIRDEFGYLEQFVVVTSSDREAVAAWTALKWKIEAVHPG